MSYHTSVSLVNNTFRTAFEQLVQDKELSGLVKPEYLHASLALYKGDPSEREENTIEALVQPVVDALAKLTTFRTGAFQVDEFGYLMLDITFSPQVQTEVNRMVGKLEEEDLSFVNKVDEAGCAHITLVQGVYGKKATPEQMAKLDTIMNGLAELCNREFSLSDAVFGRTKYPKDADKIGTVEVVKPFHKFAVVTPQPQNSDEQAKFSPSL